MQVEAFSHHEQTIASVPYSSENSRVRGKRTEARSLGVAEKIALKGLGRH